MRCTARTIAAGGLAFIFALGVCLSQARSEDVPTTTPSPHSIAPWPDAAPTTRPDPLEDAGKESDIRKLLALTKAGEIGTQVASQMIEQMRGSMPQVPDQFWEDFKRGMDPNSLIDLIIPIYSRHFTHDDIRQMIAFYDSPLGRKMTSELPAIMQESMQVGSQWGAALSRQIMERLKDHGYLKV
jgi:hypothetical protein